MNNWLQEHIKNFVLPGIKELWKHQDKLCNCGSYECSWNGDGVVDTRLKPVTHEIIPAKICPDPVAGVVYTWARSLGVTEDLLVPLTQTNDSKAMSSYFVGSHCPNGIPRYLKSSRGEVVHSMIKTSLKGLKELMDQSGKVIVLTGRDMWPWEILARKYEIATIYDPRVSRILCRDPNALLDAICSWGIDDLNRAVIFDTGFAGSIWQAICRASGDQPMNLMLSANDLKVQQWRNMVLETARAVAYCVEDTPKYWRSGMAKMLPGSKKSSPYQTLADISVFIKAAAFTIFMWNYQSPKICHVDTKRDKYELRKQFDKSRRISYRLRHEANHDVDLKKKRKEARLHRRSLKKYESLLKTSNEWLDSNKSVPIPKKSIKTPSETNASTPSSAKPATAPGALSKCSSCGQLHD